MPRRIEHRAQYAQQATTVHATLTDPGYLRARLAELGGKDAELLEHAGESFRIRHSLDAENLPGVVRRVLSGDLVIHREESWEPAVDGYRGHSTVTIDRTPARITATLRLRDTGGGSELHNTGEVSVSVPLVGGTIEDTVAEHVHRLLDAEHEFTTKWLENR